MFADRGYNDDGTLVNRALPRAFITDENIVVDRIKRMIIESKVKSVNGKDIDILAHSVLCMGIIKSGFVCKNLKACKKKVLKISPLKEWLK